MTTCGCCGLNFCCAPVRDAVCVPITKNIGYLTSLSDNVRSLEMEMADLIASHRDVVAAIEREERDGPQRRTERVDVWMTDVGRVTTDLQDFHTKYKEGRSGSKYKLSKRADRLLKQVRELRSNKSEFNGQYTRELPIPSKNVWLLRKKMPELIKSQEDVLRRAERLEGTGSQKRTDEVVRWLDRVMSLQAEYNILQGDIERVCNCEGSCSLNCGPSDELGNRANDMVEEARRLETRRAGFNENLTEKFVPPSEYVRLLRKEWDELYASRDDVLRRLNLEEMRGRKRTNKVTLWLNRVQSLEADLSGFSLSPSPSNQHGKRASELLEDVTELKRTIPGFSDDNEMTEELMSPNRDVWLLRKEMRELIASRDGLLRKVIKLEEMHGQERTNQVVSWLETVRSLEEEYDNLEVDLSNICTCHGSCYLNCSPSNELGKRSAVLLDEVRVTNTKRSELTKLVEAIPGPISLETDSPLKEALEQLHRFCFKTDEASVIGVCGMGGIGKTTLMERFEAELLHRPGDFKKIIFVVVSKEPNAQKMQKEIGMVLGLHIQDGENIERHANQILKILQDMRYALLMDDVWNGSILKKILKDIGIPLPNMINKSKLIVTTRTEKVCNQMGTGDYKVRISCLKSEEAWALFKKSVGELIINSDPDINVHAKAMAKKCGGLPLALTVIGSAMANKKTIQEWEHAASSMEELRTDKIEGMEDDLLFVLKISYDSLPNDTIRECFLYCCLYPEDYKIMKEELVDKWIGEGFFDGEYNDDIDKARGEGHSIIGILKIAHLLETGHSRDFDVRMHDVIRDMALWISSKKKDNKFLVRAGIGLTEAPESRKWSGNKRISLMDNNIKDLSCLIPDCPNLSTLFLQNNYYLSGNVTSVFFQSMTNLRILDLSRTDIKSLPIELGRLSGLRNLNLEGTGRLESIPKGAILTLGKLKLLNLRYSNYFIGDGSANVENSFCDTEVSIQDLDALKSLQEVALDLKSIDVYRQFISLTKLPRITSALVLSNSNSWGTLHLSSTLSKMDRLISLEFIYCEGLNEMIISGGENGPLLPKLRILELDSLLDLRMIKVEAHVALQNIRKLRIVHCTLLKHVEWIRNLRCLEKIHISYCDGMKKLIGGEDGVMEDNATTLTLSLPKLRSIVLGFLPKLESICKHPLLFSSLKHLIVSKCPHLKKLPLQINSAPNLKEIECEQEWWDGLVWDDELIKQKFVGSFKAMIPREFG